MSWQDASEAQVTLQDASTYFSDEEWRLLQEWQKELYRNVMKEIHQALMSLGPLISSTAISVRVKEKQTLCPADKQNLERRHINNCSMSATAGTSAEGPQSPQQTMGKPYSAGLLETEERSATGGALAGDSSTNPEKLFAIKREENLHLENHQASGTREMNKCLSADFESRKDPFGEGFEESSTDPSSGQEIFSFCIKDEQETYCIDHLNSVRAESIDIPLDDETIDTKNEATEFVPCTKTTVQGTPSLRTTTKEALQRPPKGSHSTLPLLSESYWVQREQQTPQCDRGYSTSKRFSLDRGRPRLRMSQKHNQTGSKLKNSLFFQGLPNEQQNQTLCTEFDTNYSHESEFPKHVKEHCQAKPHACTDCGKSFTYKAHLLKHNITHTGEKPHLCAFCHKSFSRKDHLQRHMRMHTGETPYKCAECGKSFTRKEHFNLHQRKHVGEDPCSRKITMNEKK